MTVAVVDVSNVLWRCAFGAGWRLDAAVDALATDPAEGERLIRDTARDAAQTAFLHIAHVLEGRAISRTVLVTEGKTNWRNELYPAYKAARRDKSEEETAAASAFFGEALRCFVAGAAVIGVDVVEPENGEADDAIAAVIATVVDDDVVVVSGDFDMLQVVRAGRVAVLLLRSGDNELIDDDAGVIRHIGVGPRLVPDFKALAGDRSDGIPGVAGIGPKGALALLELYPDGLRAIVAAAADPKTWLGSKASRTKILDGADDARLFRVLCSLRGRVKLTTTSSLPASTGVAVRALAGLSMPVVARPVRLRDVRLVLGVR